LIDLAKACLIVVEISQMDKASIIKDAIGYIEQLQAEERRVLQELEAATSGSGGVVDEQGVLLLQEDRSKKMKRAQSVPSTIDAAPPVEVLELRVSEVGDRVLVVNVTCSKRRDAMARVCRAIEELRLRVITATITTVAGRLLHTVFVEVPYDASPLIYLHQIGRIALFLDDLLGVLTPRMVAFVALTYYCTSFKSPFPVLVVRQEDSTSSCSICGVRLLILHLSSPIRVDFTTTAAAAAQLS
jgi:hypothetical protein